MLKVSSYLYPGNYICEMKRIEDLIKANFISSQQKAIVNIRYTSNFLINNQNLFMKDFDLTMPQFNVLRILRGAKKAISIYEVKERMVEKSPNTTRLIDKLEMKRFVMRVAQPINDRRKVNLEITTKGLDVLSLIDQRIDESNLFKNQLTDEEAEQLSFLLDKLRS